MEFVRLGTSGLKITVLTYGTALTIGTENLDVNYAESLITKAWDLGIRSFDTSNNYGMGAAESLLGRALKKYSRNEYVVSTKGSWPIGDSPYQKGLSRKHILSALTDSLNRLALDYVDIYYAHRFDPDVSMYEIVRIFNSLIQNGLIRYWATSEWPLDALEECHRVCAELKLEAPIAEQPIYSYAIRKIETNGVLDFCKKKCIGVLGFSPLAQGLLTGKYSGGNVPTDSRIGKSEALGYSKTVDIYNQNKEKIDFFVKIAQEHDLPPNLLALRWCLYKQVYPVVGASKPQQLQDNIRALEINIPDSVFVLLDEQIFA